MAEFVPAEVHAARAFARLAGIDLDAVGIGSRPQATSAPPPPPPPPPPRRMARMARWAMAIGQGLRAVAGRMTGLATALLLGIGF